MVLIKTDCKRKSYNKSIECFNGSVHGNDLLCLCAKKIDGIGKLKINSSINIS